MDDIYAELHRIEKERRIEDKTEVCKLHSSPLHYYCKTCEDSICSDCAMFGDTHKQHEFEKLQNVYDKHVNGLKEEISALHARLDHLQILEDSIDSNIRLVENAKEEYSSELQSLIHDMDARLTTQLKSKLLTLIGMTLTTSNHTFM
jgi:tripartite motif-containing protein 37